MIAEANANYCVNQEEVFVGGCSGGAWESVTLGLARGGVIRGIATGAGGLRKERPMPSGTEGSGPHWAAVGASWDSLPPVP